MENKTQNIPGLVLGQDQNPYDTKKILLDYNEYKSLLEVSSKLKETEDKMEETISKRVENERDKIKNEYEEKLSEEKNKYYEWMRTDNETREHEQEEQERNYKKRIRKEWDKEYDTTKEQIKERSVRMNTYKMNIIEHVNKYKKECNSIISNASPWNRLFNSVKIQLPELKDSDLLRWGEFAFGDIVSYSTDSLQGYRKEYYGVVIDAILGEDGNNSYKVFFPDNSPVSDHFYNINEKDLSHEWYSRCRLLKDIEKSGYKLDYENKKLIKL